MNQSQKQAKTCGNCNLSEKAEPGTSMNNKPDSEEVTCSITKRPHNLYDACDIDRWEPKENKDNSMKTTKKPKIGWFDECEGIRDCATVAGQIVILAGVVVREVSLSALSKALSTFSSDLSARVDRYQDKTR